MWTARPFAEQVHHLLKGRRVAQFSFGHFADEVKWVEDPDTGRMTRELHKVSLFEARPDVLRDEHRYAAAERRVRTGQGRAGAVGEERAVPCARPTT